MLNKLFLKWIEYESIVSYSNNSRQQRYSWYFYTNSNGSFIIYLSSHAVFNGEKAFYNHNDTTCPITVYGKHKNEVENYLTKNIKKNSCILRLTKVITNNTPFNKKWEN